MVVGRPRLRVSVKPCQEVGPDRVEVAIRVEAASGPSTSATAIDRLSSTTAERVSRVSSP